MFCLCVTKMNEFLAGLEAPVTELSMTLPEMPALPDLPTLPQLPELSLLAAGLPAFNMAMAMSMQMDFSMAGGLALPSAEELAGLEMMAQISGTFGISPFSMEGQAQLDLAAGSLNIAAPALGELAAILPPALPAIEGLGAAAGLVGSVEASFGVNLLLPDAMPQLELAMGEMSAELPSMEAALGGSMDLSFAAEMGLAARLINATAALGIDLTSPEGAVELSAALDIAASLEMPPFSLTTPEWLNLISLMSSLESANAAFGFPILMPGGAAELSLEMGSLEMGLGQLEANLGIPLEIPAMESGELAAAAEMGMELAVAAPAVEAGMDLGCLLSANLEGLPLGSLPEMGEMSLAATFAASFEGATGIELMSGIPCPNIFCIA